MRNPWEDYDVTGDWAAHAGYSEGGTDYPLDYGTPLVAPASGRLVVNGWAGTAGRRATLYFDTPLRRAAPASDIAMLGGYREHDCDAIAIVYQHASDYEVATWYPEGASIGRSGASASGDDWGGQAHLHTHLLCVHGARLDWLKFQQDSTVAGGGRIPIIINESEEDETMAKIIMRGEGPKEWSLVGPNGDASGCRVTTSQETANAWARIYGPAIIIDARDEYVRVQGEARAIAKTHL